MSLAIQKILWALLSLLGLLFTLWIFLRALKQSESPFKLVLKWAFTLVLVFACFALALRLGVFGPFVIVFMAIILSVMWTPAITDLLCSPLTGLFDGGNEEPEKKPLYSTALARRKNNRPLEAIMEIRKQLALFPDDFEGYMLLAGIQAEDMNDLAGAGMTLDHFCHLPHPPVRQVVAALTQLADWHLKYAGDEDSARACLQKIVDRFPGSEFALRAGQRLAHITDAGRLFAIRHDSQPIHVPEGAHNIGLMDSTEFLKPVETDPGKLAGAYVRHLAEYPHDSEAREKLATLYARDFKRLDLATMELEQIITESRHTPKQIATWLNLLATFQVELGASVADVTATLNRIGDLFPGSGAAEMAARRLARINLEMKGKEKTPGVRLGVYEQNIGLKYGSPRRL